METAISVELDRSSGRWQGIGPAITQPGTSHANDKSLLMNIDDVHASLGEHEIGPAPIDVNFRNWIAGAAAATAWSLIMCITIWSWAGVQFQIGDVNVFLLQGLYEGWLTLVLILRPLIAVVSIAGLCTVAVLLIQTDGLRVANKRWHDIGLYTALSGSVLAVLTVPPVLIVIVSIAIWIASWVLFIALCVLAFFIAIGAASS